MATRVTTRGGGHGDGVAGAAHQGAQGPSIACRLPPEATMASPPKPMYNSGLFEALPCREDQAGPGTFCLTGLDGSYGSSILTNLMTGSDQGHSFLTH